MVLRKTGQNRMNMIAAIEFKKLKRLVPSQFFSMKNCTYKSVLAEAFDKKPLLPVSPNAYLGRVLHKVLELIAKNEISSDLEFDAAFDSEVLSVEEMLTREGNGYFVPLQMNVRDFGLKKIQLKKHLRSASKLLDQPKSTKYSAEKWLESKDKLIGGKIDLIIDVNDEAEIIDFKTGAITESSFDDEGESSTIVKREYQEQLKLYAYLFFEKTGRLPSKLTLIDLSKQKFNVAFSYEECITLSEQAKMLLGTVNNSIESKQFSANPTDTNCKFCLYRPACSFYLDQLKRDHSFNDISGVIHNVTQYRNGNVSVFISNGDKMVTIAGISHELFEFLNSNRNKVVSVFNLKKESANFVYSATKTTKIYEQ
jgi:CRISPR/Cas system-associated exonuclease Cas4 (RecB family)